MLKKGLFNSDLKHQTLVIGFLYAGLAIFGLFYGIVLLQYSVTETYTNNGEVEWNKIGSQIEESQKATEKYLSSLLDNRKTVINRKRENVTAISAIEGMLGEASSIDDDVETILHHSEEELNGSPNLLQSHDNATFNNTVDSNDLDLDESIENTLNISREITNVTQISTEIPIESDVLTLTSEESFTTSITVPKHVKQLDSLLDNEGIEAIFASIVRLACSIVLILGVKSGQHWFLIPWIVVESIEMAAFLFKLIVKVAVHGSWSLMGIFMLILLYVLGGYFLYSVVSFHSLLRRMSKQSKEVITSVSHGGFQSDMNYRKLQDDTWVIDPPLAVEFSDRDSGFTREKITSEENDDYVLYVKSS